MEGGAPKGRRLDGGSGMKEREIVSSTPLYESTRAPLTRSPFPNGEGCDTQDTAFFDTTPFPRGKAKRRRLRRPKRKGLAWTLHPSYGRMCPEGAEVGWGKRYEKEENCLKCAVYESTLSTAHAVPLPQWGRLRYEDTAFLASSKRIQDTWRKRITTDKAFPAWGRWRAKRAG